MEKYAHPEGAVHLIYFRHLFLQNEALNLWNFRDHDDYISIKKSILPNTLGA